MARWKVNTLNNADDGRWNKHLHLDHLHLFVGDDTFTAETVDTANGPAKAVKVGDIVCLDCLQPWKDQLVFGARLIPRLDGAEPPVPGRLGQGLARPGKSPAWILDDATSGDKKQAEDFLEQYATTLPSGKIMLDERAIEAARQSLADEQY
jgi:hypothetical protein